MSLPKVQLFLSTTCRAVGAHSATIAMGAALIAGLATTARAQATTTSQTRIPITKDAPGEVILQTRIDTVTVVRVDTTRVYSTDTLRVNVPGPVTINTVVVTRIDTVTVQLAAPARVTRDGFYIGLGSGPAMPRGPALGEVNSTGAVGQLNVGWQGLNNFVGVRADENYASYAVQGAYSGLDGHPVVWNTSLDLTLQVPYLTHLWGMAPRFVMYAIGGPTYVRYDNLRMALDPGQKGTGPANVGLVDDTWRGNLGYNLGGGMSLHWTSTTAVFAEVRVISFNTSVSPTARQVPITIGLNFY